MSQQQLINTALKEHFRLFCDNLKWPENQQMKIERGGMDL